MRFPPPILHDIAAASAENCPAPSRQYQKAGRFPRATCPAASPEALASSTTAALEVARVFSAVAQTVCSRSSPFQVRTCLEPNVTLVPRLAGTDPTMRSTKLRFVNRNSSMLAAIWATCFPECALALRASGSVGRATRVQRDLRWQESSLRILSAIKETDECLYFCFHLGWPLA